MRKGFRKPRPWFKCPVCQKDFQPKMASHKRTTCSRECRMRYIRSKQTVGQLLRWKVSRVPQMKEWERGYIAGIIDGEGSISIAHDKGGLKVSPHYRPTVYVVNTDLKILDQVGRILAIPRTLKPQSLRHWGKKPTYTFILSSHQDTKCLLEQILPYLSGKKDRAELMLKFVDYKLAKKSSIGITTEETEMYLRMKELNA